MHKLARVLIFLPLLALAACSTGFSGDVTPPENYQPPLTAQPAVTEAAAQAVQPAELTAVSPANGWQIYNEYCALCHGNTGRGDGEHAARFTNPVPDLGDPERTRAAVPQAWYDLVSAGHPEQNMPAFMELLSDSQRRDVTAYLFTLPVTREVYEAGAAVYDQACSACHGTDGSGAADGTPDWTTLDAFFTSSNEQIFESLGAGAVSAHEVLVDLAEDERWQVVSYVRMLSLGPDLPDFFTPSLQAASSQSAEAETITINGKVSIPAGSLPEGLTAVLHGYDGTSAEPVLELDAALKPDGTYTFEDVSTAAETVYLVTVDYNDLRFSSDVVHAGDTAPGQAVDLPVVIYDSTSDASTLVADRVHVFFDFSTPGTLSVIEMYVISNTGSKIVIPAAEGQAVVAFTPPQGASDLRVDNSSGQPDLFKVSEAGVAYLAPIYPGTPATQVLFGYNLPYENRRITVNWVPALPVTSAVIGFPAEGLKLSSDQLAETGVRDMQGSAIKIFSGSNLEANQPVKLTISGRVPGTAGTNNLAAILIGAAGLLLAVVGAVLWFIRRRKIDAGDDPASAESPDTDVSEEDLLDAIVALDDLYQAGSLKKDVYTERRAALKDALQKEREK